jgi:hypothetical protein
MVPVLPLFVADAGDEEALEGLIGADGEDGFRRGRRHLRRGGRFVPGLARGLGVLGALFPPGMTRERVGGGEMPT